MTRQRGSRQKGGGTDFKEQAAAFMPAINARWELEGLNIGLFYQLVVEVSFVVLYKCFEHRLSSISSSLALGVTKGNTRRIILWDYI